MFICVYKIYNYINIYMNDFLSYLKDNDIFTSFLTIQMVVFAENF